MKTVELCLIAILSNFTLFGVTLLVDGHIEGFGALVLLLVASSLVSTCIYRLLLWAAGKMFDNTPFM